MCEYSRRLVAWIDREVEADEAAEIERHLAACAECGSCIVEFRRVSGDLDEYCQQIAQTADGRKAIPLQPVLWATAAAILLAVILGYSRRHVTPPIEQPNRAAITATHSPSPATTPVAESLPAPFPPSHRRAHRPLAASTDKGAESVESCTSRDCAPATLQATAGATADMTEGPAIQITIPADAMFPPGAVPEGMSFVADLSIAADGFARQVRLQREIPEFERRLSQP